MLEVLDGSAFRNLRVKKYRGSGFAADEFPITLTAGGLEVAVDGGRLRIVREGRSRKFVRAVEQLSFSAAHSRSRFSAARRSFSSKIPRSSSRWSAWASNFTKLAVAFS